MSTTGDVDGMLEGLVTLRPLSERELEIAGIFTCGCQEFYPFRLDACLSEDAKSMLKEIEDRLEVVRLRCLFREMRDAFLHATGQPNDTINWALGIVDAFMPAEEG